MSPLLEHLRALKDELRGLSRELDRLRALRAATDAAGLRSLRRRLALACHPDRGGDPGLLRDVNALLDVLEGVS